MTETLHSYVGHIFTDKVEVPPIIVDEIKTESVDIDFADVPLEEVAPVFEAVFSSVHNVKSSKESRPFLLSIKEILIDPIVAPLSYLKERYTGPTQNDYPRDI